MNPKELFGKDYSEFAEYDPFNTQNFVEVMRELSNKFAKHEMKKVYTIMMSYSWKEVNKWEQDGYTITSIRQNEDAHIAEKDTA